MKKTSDVTKRRNFQVRLICIQDIIDAQSERDLRYIYIRNVGGVYGITPNAVRYQIRHHRLRWRRLGTNLQVCVSDLEQFILPINGKSVDRPKPLLGQLA